MIKTKTLTLGMGMLTSVVASSLGGGMTRAEAQDQARENGYFNLDAWKASPENKCRKCDGKCDSPFWDVCDACWSKTDKAICPFCLKNHRNFHCQRQCDICDEGERDFRRACGDLSDVDTQIWPYFSFFCEEDTCTCCGKSVYHLTDGLCEACLAKCKCMMCGDIDKKCHTSGFITRICPKCIKQLEKDGKPKDYRPRCNKCHEPQYRFSIYFGYCWKCYQELRCPRCWVIDDRSATGPDEYCRRCANEMHILE